MTEKGQPPRLLFAAPASGSGKTMITCGVLAALKKRGLRPAAFKCGPDFIDPLYLGKVTGESARSLDTFFMGEDTPNQLAAAQKDGHDLCIIEGVMGLYDGIGGTSVRASSYDLARTTDTPVILIVDARGMSLSLIPLIQGFVNYPKEAQIGDNVIAGVLLNRATASTYRTLRGEIERQTGLRVYGYLPDCEEARMKSRHLGLTLPDEDEDFARRIEALSERIGQCVDLDGLLALAAQAGVEAGDDTKENLRPREASQEASHMVSGARPGRGPVLCRDSKAAFRIAVAKDEAFCFYYEDNLDLLREMGADLVFFSPLHDEKLPEGSCGLILGGGYPELFAQQLSWNDSMKESIRAAIAGGIPYLAECGGFLYLHETMEDLQGKAWPMCGIYPAEASYTGRLGSFGYVTLCGSRPGDLLPDGEKIRGHEYHYYQSSDPGASCTAVKPGGGRQWPCMHLTDHSAAGFPHLYYRSDPEMAARFANCVRNYAAIVKGEKA